MFYPVIPVRQIPFLPLHSNIISSEMITSCKSFKQSRRKLYVLVWDLSILPFLRLDPLSNHGPGKCQVPAQRVTEWSLHTWKGCSQCTESKNFSVTFTCCSRYGSSQMWLGHWTAGRSSPCAQGLDPLCWCAANPGHLQWDSHPCVGRLHVDRRFIYICQSSTEVLIGSVNGHKNKWQ